MLTVSLLSLVLSVPAQNAPLTWLKDYDQATARAVKEKKDLVIVFQEDGDLNDVLADKTIVQQLKKRFVCLRLPVDYQYEGKRLLDTPALSDMMGKPGLAIVSMHDDQLPTHWQVISAHPLAPSRYRWVPSFGVEQMQVVLDLPAKATLSQRSMIYAVSVHPEEPQSVYGECHPAFLGHAESHSRRQASMQSMHHANLGAVMGRLGVSGASEVVATSWGRVVGGENVLEACYSAIDGWRNSAGHWRSVSGRQRYFGYDIAQGNNGTWYATGIFGN